MKGKMPTRVKSKNPVVILKAVIKAIQEEPKRYDQSIVYVRHNSGSDRQPDYFPSCGTVACVAGWVNILTGVRNKYDVYRAGEKLGLEDTVEMNKLFGIGRVPWRKDMTPEAHAKAGVAHIRRFVKAKWGKNI